MNDESLEDKLETQVSETSEPKNEETEVKIEVENSDKVEAIRHWIDDIFIQEQERLGKQGIFSAEQWVKAMAAIDRALNLHPKETLQYLAQVYGISLSVDTKTAENSISKEIFQCLKNLEQNQKNLWQALDAQHYETRQLTISNFASAKDDEGKLRHPYFPIVEKEMFALLNSGVAFDFESAYEKALWINPQTRAELLEKQKAEDLQALADEAEKAKSAGFSPQGGLEKEDYSQMTTREILEHTYKELEG